MSKLRDKAIKDMFKLHAQLDKLDPLDKTTRACLLRRKYYDAVVKVHGINIKEGFAK